MARCDPALAVGARAWDRDAMRLGTPGGPIDLATGLAVAADPDQGLRRGTGVTPAHDAACPIWRRFLGEACGGDDATIGFLARFLGYALTGLVTEQAMLICQGPSGTGKSVFLATLLHVLGDHAVSAPLALLSADPDRHATGLATLDEARLVAIANGGGGGGGRRWDGRRLNALVGGDPLIVGGRPFTPRFKLLVIGDRPLRLEAADAALRRRLRIVAFLHRPPVPDRDLAEKLRAEAPGILRWMIEGCGAWRRDGLGDGPALDQATADSLTEEDTFGLFLAAHCDQAPDRTAPAGALYRAWCAWAADAGEDAGSQRELADALSARGFSRDRTDTHRLYRGLALKPGRMTRDA